MPSQTSGSRVGPYELVSPLGAGGMGQVWKARDTRLDRTVAIKFSKEAFSDRFQREARAIAALNHPNIATLFDVGPDYLVMELVEGAPVEPTDDPRKLLDLATQIADGLASAHAAGFIHRDLKPDNILVNKEGRVKILDFGLAKQTSAPAQDEATLTVTQPGTVMGTVAYMSPEQARGAEVDARSDQFSFGLVLYELAAGKRPFQRASAAETMAAIIREDAPPLPAPTPLPLRWIIERLLSKDPGGRYASSKDLFLDLRGASARLSEATAIAAAAAPPIRQGRRAIAAVGVALAGALAALLAITAIRPAWLAPTPSGDSEPRITRFFIPAESPTYPIISPDGRHVAYTAGPKRTLHIRDLDRDDSREIPVPPSAGMRPFWSPDSRYLAFNQGLEIVKIPVTGGPPIQITTMPSNAFYTGTWSHDGEIIVFGSGTPPSLYQVPARGGSPKLIAESGKRDLAALRDPSFLPVPGRHVIAFCAGSTNTFTMDLDSGQVREIGLDGQFPMYSRSGFMIYQRRTSPALWAAPFSLEQLRTAGDPFPVRDAQFVSSVSDTGTLAYIDPGESTERRLSVRDRSGKVLGVAGLPQRRMTTPAVSPDGERIAVAAAPDNQIDIWIHEVGRPARTRLTSDERVDSDPVWSPLGDRILFSSLASRLMSLSSLWIRHADGSGQQTEILRAQRPLTPTDWARDLIFFGTRMGFPRGRLSHFKENDPKSAVVPGDDPAFTWAEAEGRLSPDGRLLAYSSNESGSTEIYIRRFPEGTGKRLVSTGGGARPRWRKDGREIFYRAGRSIMAVPITPEAEKLKAPVELFRLSNGAEFDAFPDGQRFVTTDSLADARPATLRIVQNWSAEFRDRRGASK